MTTLLVAIVRLRPFLLLLGLHHAPPYKEGSKTSSDTCFLRLRTDYIKLQFKMADSREEERRKREKEEKDRKARQAEATRQCRERQRQDEQRLKEIQEQKKRQQEENKRREMKIESLRRQEKYMKTVFSEMNRNYPAFGRDPGVSKYL